MVIRHLILDDSATITSPTTTHPKSKMSNTFEEDFLALLAISPRVQDAIRALRLVPKPQTGANATRDADIIQRVNAGEPRRTLAAEYSVSIDRINQIMRGNTITQPKPRTSQAKPLTDRPIS